MSTSQPLILIVGAADTGRAPMAVALLRRLLRQRGHSWSVESAGVVGHDGDPAEPEARDTMFTLGLDISGHRARSLDDALVESAGLLIAVDRGVARVLRGRPDQPRVVALSELAPGSRDIPDPFRMQVGAWMIYAREIEATLRAGLPRLAALLGAADGADPASEPQATSSAPATPSEGTPAVVTIHPARAAALERAERLLGLLADAPAVIDWQAARDQLGADLGEIAARPLTPGDLAEPYAALVRAMLGLSASAPRPAQIGALRAAIARMRGPLAPADISALSALLPTYAAE